MNLNIWSRIRHPFRRRKAQAKPIIDPSIMEDFRLLALDNSLEIFNKAAAIQTLTPANRGKLTYRPVAEEEKTE